MINKLKPRYIKWLFYNRLAFFCIEKNFFIFYFLGPVNVDGNKNELLAINVRQFLACLKMYSGLIMNCKELFSIFLK